ncbi:DUF998 domain-containing protein [Streptomyces sp. GC420]|uniref:DUF998 domain-containing protein n=1 Tax=Streptomyces sp. GC420 TaxID=2697568 RepID=UPI001AA146A7|nr:DUF998 domain-containing protein [Streptomyces sp. GC420]
MTGAAVALGGLIASAVALAVAPAVMPPGYSWVSRTTSESAAQGLSGAWVARLGFVLFGLSVVLLATVCRRRWGVWGVALHAAFGALMTAAAAFSHKPWQATGPYDRTEDVLHSVAASTMGIAFALGIVAVALSRRALRRRVRLADAVAVAASVVLPLGMTVLPDVQGVLQRLIFVVAYAWYATEAVLTIRQPGPRAFERG